MNKTVFRNPRSQIIPVKENFYLALNPGVNNGIKILNEQQVAVLREMDGQTSIEEIVNATGYPTEVIVQLLDIFGEIELIGYSPDFTEPQLPTEARNIDFWVHTTDACNFNCPYCYIDKTKNKSIRDDVLEKFIQKIVTLVEKRNLAEISLRFSGGEPLLRFHQVKEAILKIKSELKSRDCKTNIGFLTNLTLLNQEIVSFIQQENLYTSISLDGFGVFHDKTRHFKNNRGSFHIVDKNINTLLEAGHSRIIIMTVISNRNLDGLPELAHYLAKKNIPFRFSIVTGEEIDQAKLKKKLFEVYDIFERYIKDSSYAFARNHHLDDLRFLSPSYRPCSAGFMSGGLYTDGKIYFCQQELGNGEDSGSVFDETDLIQNIQTKQHRHTQLHDDCESCSYRYVCSGGCPLYRINGKSPHCGLYKELLPRIYQLIGLERYYRLKQANRKVKAE
ncbi:hypothetical protein PbJCM13498_38350 [Prolixibacter bellariivorans]|uniref:Radical SAM core domain-containing protein n=1 Tax=Prolixibacter bellariivorans TaxID=314319 RepID=A0A5M4B4A1_9BACT|nr:radical SAM protein [Prolixibacter bellariivorans]GET34972.1 hypothetical protein PbJCM13498_38350 [Prolixibacter bellariivorans]